MPRIARTGRWRALVLPAALAACSANRTIALTPGPAGVAQYLASQHPLDLFVTDAAGQTQWLHEPYLDGDTLRGLRNRELPPERVAVPVTRIQSLAVPEISSGRTLGLVGGLFGAAILTILIIGSVGPQPVY